MSQAPYDLERLVARSLGGRRSGRGFAGPDVIGEDFAYAAECKRMKRLGLRAADLAQARAQAKAAGKPMLLVLRAHGQQPIVVLEWRDFLTLHEQATT